jgi:hypothetical protein
MKYFVPYKCGTIREKVFDNTNYLFLVLKFQQIFNSPRTLKQFIYKSKHEGISSALKTIKKEIEINLKNIRDYKSMSLVDLEKILSSLECCRSIILYQRESDKCITTNDEQTKNLISIEKWIEKISIWYYSLEDNLDFTTN